MLTPELCDLPELGHDALIVTAGQRLARSCRQFLATSRATEQVIAWREPEILPFDAWLRHCHTQLTLHADVPAADVLSSAQSAVIWRNACQHVLQEQGLPLVGITTLASDCHRAFSLMQSWQLADRDLHAYPPGDNSLLFERCLVDFRRQQQAQGWLTDAELGSYVLQHAAMLEPMLPRTRWFAGFSQLTPLQRALCDAFNMDYRQHAQSHSSDAPVSSFDSADDELVAAGAWARVQLQRNPASQLAIVVTNLDQHRERFRTRVLEGLDPQSLGFDAALGLEVSAAPRLAEYPAIHTALQLFAWAAEPVRFAKLSRLLRQPTISDLAQTAALDVSLRERPDRYWTVNAFSAWLEDQDATLAWLRPLLVLAGDSRQAQSASAWAARYATFLEDISWLRGGAPDSAAFQLMNAMHSALNVLASLDHVLTPMRLSAATRHLQQILSDTVFQPQASFDNLLLCGPLELAGLALDGIWLAGCDANHWPPLASPSTLLSPALQRAHNMPDASAGQARRFWFEQFRQLSVASEHCSVSFARHDGDSELLPSPVIAGRTVVETPTPQRGLSPWVATAALSEQADDVGTFAASRILKSGFRALQRQSTDPFGAMIVGRWRPQLLVEPEVGINALLRGKLVHDSLEQLYLQCKQQAALESAITSDDRAIADAVTRAFARRFIHQDALTQTMLRAEEARTRQLLTEFVEQELHRAPFSVATLEQKVPLTVGPVTMNLRIDRIDEIDGQRVIIDYKTGARSKAIKAETLVDDYPQLACYLLAVQEPIAAVALAWINQQPACWDALRSAIDLQLPQARVTRIDSPTLADVRAHSETQLFSIASAFASGVLTYSAQLHRNRDLWLEFAPITRIAMDVLHD